jgi:arginyl-tRNA synthetase
MQNLEQIISACLNDFAKEVYGQEVPSNTWQYQKTRKEFEGDITLVVFPLLRMSKKGPEQTGEEIGLFLKEKLEIVTGFNTVKGFLNIEVSDAYWLKSFDTAFKETEFGSKPSSGKTYLVEFSSPNTNKPLHLGHLRNIFLGDAVSSILEANGHEVIRTQIINDRGIHICKSMLAWQNAGLNESPDSTGLKGDKLVGKYYVEFDKQYKKEIASLVESGMDKEEAEKKAPSLLAAQEMLRKWEAGDPEVTQLWSKMNAWVYTGFDGTYKQMNVSFDKLYYESDTYLLGKSVVEEGLSKGVFFKKEDGSVWCDLTNDGLDEKLVLRSDGTAVYMTQDIGTAIERYKDFPNMKGMIYTVGNEQDYHFKVLFLILKKLGYDWANECYHLSYGMVDLPTGKMKSREGTVVDADDLMLEMVQEAKNSTEELGKLEGLSENEVHEICDIIGMGALKYYLLKVDPKKRMMFNPEESIDLQGNTGPFIQYAYTRTNSLIEKAGSKGSIDPNLTMNESEKELLQNLLAFPASIETAANEYNPGHLANYTFELVKSYNSFYQNNMVLKEEDEKQRNFRIALSFMTGKVIKTAMHNLGIKVPQRM